MSRGISRQEIPKLVLKGMKAGAGRWTGLHGTWAWCAPEYWFTVHTALALEKHLNGDKCWIGLEQGVRETLSLSRDRRPGRPPKALRTNGRCDIVVARANEKPFAAIEIKSPVWSFSELVRKDIARMKAMMSRVGQNSLSVACLALYTSASEDQTRLGARGTLERRLERNLELSKEMCRPNRLLVRDERTIVKPKHTDDCWAVQCIYITRS